MRIKIHTKNIELTKAIEDYVNDKIGSLKKMLNLNSPILAEVEVGMDSRHHQKGDVFRAEVNLTINGKLFRAECVKDDLYAAIDEVRDELLRELRKNKTRKENFFKRGAQKLKNLLRREPKNL